jgi:hypothetical protein
MGEGEDLASLYIYMNISSVYDTLMYIMYILNLIYQYIYLYV